ncbi:cytochrome c oxidase subunit 3 [bacterium SCSIO 12741]|nr:cytochrome c oxidase subunit 3 [bacterium SCSIO 12741]
MAGEVTKIIDQNTLWGGGRSPFSVSYGKMMMWFFLISDALTFGGLLAAIGYMRHKIDNWPVSEEVFTHFPFTHAHLPLMYVAFMTFILIVSSVTMVLAVEAGHRMDRKGVTFWLGLTVLGGAIFVGSQAWEWATFIAGPDGDISTWADNATLTQNYYAPGFSDPDNVGGFFLGPVQYSQFFFFVTGFHGTHVLSGVIINLIIFIQVTRGTYEKTGHYEMVEKVGLYWHFVDLVWVFVFTFFYLL